MEVEVEEEGEEVEEEEEEEEDDGLSQEFLVLETMAPAKIGLIWSVGPSAGAMPNHGGGGESKKGKNVGLEHKKTKK